MRHMRRHHQETISANARLALRVHGPVYGDILAKHRALANNHAARIVRGADMLRHTAQYGAFADHAIAAQHRTAFNC